MNFLVDHNISHHIAHALAAVAAPGGHMVVAKREKFDTTVRVRDVDWLGLLGQEGGWAFISDDHRIYKTRRSGLR